MRTKGKEKDRERERERIEKEEKRTLEEENCGREKEEKAVEKTAYSNCTISGAAQRGKYCSWKERILEIQWPPSICMGDRYANHWNLLKKYGEISSN